MNNLNNIFKNFNNFPNILPNNNINQTNLNNVQDPYQGFISGNMFKNLYYQYKINAPFEIRPDNEQAELLTNIDALNFAVTDLNLYLDVNPDDKEVINLFNKYRIQLNEIQKIYENNYGPLNLSSDSLNTYPWAWNNRPWPWDN